MASNLSSIGFAFKDAGEFEQTMVRLAGEASERVSCSAGDYVIWRSKTGASVWFHVGLFGDEDSPQDIEGLTPFFEGSSSVRVRIDEPVQRTGDNAFEGLLRGWVLGDSLDLAADVAEPEPEAGTGNEVYPVLVDAVDFAAHVGQSLPFVCRARITSFAQELEVYPDEAALAAAQGADADDGFALASRAFIPIGMFGAVDETDDQASDEVAAVEGAQAEPVDTGEENGDLSAGVLFTGKVASHHELVNEETGLAFHWLTVESLDATFDVVADPEIVSGDLAEGAFVVVTGLLFGRLIGEDDAA